MNPNDSALHDDLTGKSHDAIYRAMSFIAKQGGPQIDGSVDDFENLVAHRACMLAWLQAHHEPTTLANGYLAFRDRWSPIFKD